MLIRRWTVIATKYTIGYTHVRPDVKFHVNYTGNSSKSLHVSVRPHAFPHEDGKG